MPGYGQTHRLLTTLLDPEEASALDLICTYHERWEIEVAIDEIDTHQHLLQRTLRSKKPVGVIQELYGVLLAYYAVRALMCQAAQQQELDPDRLSFTYAVQVITQVLPDFQRAEPTEWPWLEQWLLQELCTVVLPERQLCSNPRVVKRATSKFEAKKPAQAPPQPELGAPLSQRKHVVLLI